MKAARAIKNHKGAIVTGALVIAAICIVILSGLIASCSSRAEAGSVDAKDGIAKAVEGTGALAESFEIDMSDTADEEAAAEVTADETSAEPMAQGQIPEPSSASSAHDSQGSGSAVPSNANAQTPAIPSDSQKKWVEETQQVWVEDKAAWSESVPVYGTKEVSICNVCGVDISGNTSAHGKAHMLAGEGSGHHSEVRQVITGYNTVSHAAEGHWETKVVGGHWE